MNKQKVKQKVRLCITLSARLKAPVTVTKNNNKQISVVY